MKFFQIPSPTEIFELFQSEGAKSTKLTWLNPVKNLNQYADMESKALNFGVYASDLLFLSTFHLMPEVENYFDSFSQLAKALGMENSKQESAMERVLKNIHLADSLKAIINEVFYETSYHLEIAEQHDLAALMLAGSWIEGVYLSLKLAQDIENNFLIKERIAEQKYSLQNLLEYFSTINSQNLLATTKTQLNELMTVFDSIQEIGTDEKALYFDEQKYGAAQTLFISDEQFHDIRLKIGAIRNQITGN